MMAGRLRTLLKVCLLLLSLSCVWVGASLLLAELSAFQVKAFLDDWSVRKQVPNEQVWNVAHTAATRAVSFAPFESAKYYEQLGLVHSWRYRNHLYGDLEAQSSRREAIQSYRRAIELRPLWPYTYLRITQMKLALLEFDNEFDRAINSAFQYGPWRITVNEPLAMLGLVAWHELNEQQKELILKAIERVQADAGALGRVMLQAQRYHHLGVVCPKLNTKSSTYKKYCTESKK